MIKLVSSLVLSSLMAYRENSGQDDAQFKPKRKFKIEKADMNTQSIVEAITFIIQAILLTLCVVVFCKGDNTTAGKAFLSIIAVGFFGFFWKHNYSYSKE